MNPTIAQTKGLTMKNDLKLWQFDLKVAVLEPYSDLQKELQGAEPNVDFEPLKFEILHAIEGILQEHAGSMKALVQVQVGEITARNVPGLIR